MLLQTLKLAFEQESPYAKAVAYVIDPNKGMIIMWSNAGKCQKFPSALDAYQTTDIVWDWLESNPEIALDGWDADFDDSDVTCYRGWRAYCEDWGHVGETEEGRYAIAAIKPSYLWYGK